MHYEKHALVLGASGISGWALVNQARIYPSETTFSKISAQTNRPLSREDALIPDDDRIDLFSGVDFTQDVDEVTKVLQDKVKDIDTVTHIYFTAYIDPSQGYAALSAVNNTLLTTSITALSTLCPHLETVILQTGGKAYGVEFKDDPSVTFTPPLSESCPRIPEPLASNIFYYSQHDILTRLSADKSWSFVEVRPDVIVGFVPHSNAMDAARGIALYLSLWREVRGLGSEVPFPGTNASWKALHTDTNQDVLARFEIFASLKPETCGKGEAYNIADASQPTTWEGKWPALCEYFGLRGCAPEEGKKEEKIAKIQAFVGENKEKWSKVVQREGLKINAMETYRWGFFEAILVGCDFDRQYDLSKARRIGFEEEIETAMGYLLAFGRLREAKIIPGA